MQWRNYLELTKPRVVLMMLITSIIGMHLATPHFVPINILLFATLGIGFCAGAAAVINHLVDCRIDRIMQRTQHRPVATGKISQIKAMIFAFVLAITGMTLLIYFVNPLTAMLTFLSLIGYACVYTLFLKYATPQNIVIGGLAGAAPPLLGWVAVTGHIDPASLLLVLIIYTWTPPHFWALAIYREEEYQKAKIPMLPVTHGIQFTKVAIILYTLLMIAATLLPYVIGMSHELYAVAAFLLGLRFLYWSIKLFNTNDRAVAMKTFRFSIFYLLLIFIFLLLDHYLS